MDNNILTEKDVYFVIYYNGNISSSEQINKHCILQRLCIHLSHLEHVIECINLVIACDKDYVLNFYYIQNII